MVCLFVSTQVNQSKFFFTTLRNPPTLSVPSLRATSKKKKQNKFEFLRIWGNPLFPQGFILDLMPVNLLHPKFKILTEAREVYSAPHPAPYSGVSVNLTTVIRLSFFSRRFLVRQKQTTVKFFKRLRRTRGRFKIHDFSRKVRTARGVFRWENLLFNRLDRIRGFKWSLLQMASPQLVTPQELKLTPQQWAPIWRKRELQMRRRRKNYVRLGRLVLASDRLRMVFVKQATMYKNTAFNLYANCVHKFKYRSLSTYFYKKEEERRVLMVSYWTAPKIILNAYKSAYYHAFIRNEWLRVRRMRDKRYKSRRLILNCYWRVGWSVRRRFQLKRLLTNHLSKYPSFKLRRLVGLYVLRLDAFLTRVFYVRTLKHARWLIKAGHVYVNGCVSTQPTTPLQRFDVITLSLEARAWLNILLRRKLKRLRKGRMLVSRRMSGAVISGPDLRYSVLWNPSRFRSKVAFKKNALLGLSLNTVKFLYCTLKR